MNTLFDTLWYFCYIMVELVVLFIVITALVEIILMYIPQEKISKKIEKAGFFGNVMAAGFGALTPFCAYSTLPMTVGFLNAGVPFGGAGMAIPEMSMLASIFKKKLVAMIVAVIFLTAVISGYIFNIFL